tara:strand:- start:2469 stop:3149 length:681 start_codon:yes stop_codon:yes gene_type:complete
VPNYAFLKTDIINTSENDSSEFEEHIPYFIEKAEIRLTKDLDDVGLTEFSSFSFTASNPVVSLPADTRIVQSVNYKTSVSSNITTLLQRPYEYAIDYFPHASTSTGTPRYYARKNQTSLYIVPTPASTLSGEISYVRRPIGLASATGTSVTTSNYFSEYCYDALFYACMLEANRFMKNPNGMQMYQGDYVNAVEGLRNQARRSRQDNMETAHNPSGGPNVLVKGSN